MTSQTLPLRSRYESLQHDNSTMNNELAQQVLPQQAQPCFQSSVRADKRIELKFMIDSVLAEQLRTWARCRLEIDTQASAAEPGNDVYRVSTLYLDTVNLDLFYRKGDASRTKHRLRRYGNEPQIWLETKKKIKSVVQKRRTRIDDSELDQLRITPRVAQLDDAPCAVAEREIQQGDGTGGHAWSDWSGDWFRQRIAARKLVPSAIVYYERFARVGDSSCGPLRFTIDRGLTGHPLHAWSVPASDSKSPAKSGDVEILELKFHSIMPPIFKELLARFPLVATGFSKYRTCLKHSQVC